MGIEGTVYIVNLGAGTVTAETLPEATYRRYPGGSLLATCLLMKHLPRGADPLGPENVLVFATSPLAGLPISGQSRMSAAARSPLTGAIGDSQCGGFFPAEMKSAGADAIVFLGKSPQPVYLFLKDGQAELRPAAHLWGRVTGEVEAAIKAELDDQKVQIAQVGPAGENLVRFAAIMNMANRANGRTGMGAVMGSKNLKAVVVRATGKRPLPARPEQFRDLVRRLEALQQANPGIVHFGKFGTAGVVDSQNYRGGLPTHNYQSGHFGEAARAINGETLYNTLLKERDTCYACAIKCKRVVEVNDPDCQVDPLYGGPEYETIATFGSYSGVSDLKAIAKASELCNKYGMDTISCGATIAWAMEAAEKGLLDDGGLGLRFGNAGAMLAAVEAIARRTGVGDLLAEGSRAAAARLGPEAVDLTITVKGQEIPAHMPQVKRSLGLIYAVNPFGADHQSSEHDGALRSKPGSLERKRLTELGILDNLDMKDLSPAKVRFAYWTQVFYSALDTLGLCQFVWGTSWQLYGPAETVELVQAATGWDTSLWELMKAGERRLNLLRAFNAREGIGQEADKLPVRLFAALRGGPTDGLALAPAELDQARELYYQMAGWDPATGYPTRAKLEELDLGWAAV